MIYTKLDRWARRHLEHLFQQRQREALQVKSDEFSARLKEMAVRRLKAIYDDAQADMPVLRKYHLASQVEAVNFDVYNPKANPPGWNDRIGTKVDLPGYYIPGPHSGYVSLYLGGYKSHEDHNSADWQFARELIHLRDTYQDEQRREFEAFKVVIRATSSWRKLEEQFPWIAELRQPAPVQELAA